MEPTSSRGKSPWKVKQVRGSRAGGIKIPKGAILVNQGLLKVKLEENFVELKPGLPLPMEIRQDENSRAKSSEAVSDGEAITEEYIVTKVEVDIPNVRMSSEEIPAAPTEEDAQDHCDSSSQPEDLESFKSTVKQLSLQMKNQHEVNKKPDEAIKKQNDVIAGMKSFIRNIGLSITTYFNDCEEQEDWGCHGNNEDFLGNNSSSYLVQTEVIQEKSKEEDHRKSEFANVNGTGGGSDSEIPTDELSKNHTSVIMESNAIDDPLATQSIITDNMNVDGEGVEGYQGSCGSPETSSSEVGLMAEQNAEDQEGSDLDNDNQDDADVQNNDNDSSYVPDDFEAESDNGLEDEQDRQDIQLKSTQLSSKTIKGSIKSATKSTANSEGSYRCSNCGKNYKTKKSLREHMHNIHSGKNVQVKCHLCPRVFKERSGLRYHVSSIHEHVRYKCAHCPGTFTKISQVVLHEKQVHVKGGPPKQQCKICGIHLVNSEISLRFHMVSMHNKSRAKCLPKEGKPKKEEGTPKKNEATPKKKKSMAIRRTKIFQCQLCPSFFPGKGDLSCHLSQSHGITNEDELGDKQ